MWRIRREIEEKRLSLVLFDKTHRLGEKYIRAVALKLLEFPVSFVGIVEIGVTPVVRRLPDAATAMPDDVLKPPILRAVWGVVAEVPFTNHSRAIAIFGKDIRNRFLIRVQHRSSRAGAISARSSRVAPRHQRSACWGAIGADVEISESNRLSVKPIDIWRFQNRVAVTR